MKVSQHRWSSLWRYHERVLDASSLLIAITRSQLSERDSFYDRVEERMAIQLTDLIHDFSYHARKSLELAEEHQTGVLQKAKKQLIHRYQSEFVLDEIDKTKVPLTQKDFWWVLGRIIHSRESLVAQLTGIEIYGRSGKIRSHFRPCVFSFRSDLDKEDQRHFVHTESLVGTYLDFFSESIEQAIESSLKPVSKTSDPNDR
jgi:hypothetical protein